MSGSPNPFAGRPASDKHETQQKRYNNRHNDQTHPHLSLARWRSRFAVLREFTSYEVIVVEIIRIMRVVIVTGINVVVAKAALSADSGVRGQIGSAVRTR
ncbi:MAG: hypothetical protein P8J37_01630 [Fuerstiella sp.]|nr:hypothetical protein [Fuerstiella sp.]